MESLSPSVQSVSLSELNHDIRQVLRGHFKKGIWVVAEISEIKTNASGHCYLELVRKRTANDKILAKARANIWAYSYRMLKPYFESTTRRSLEAGLKIMILVQVEFHEVYGLSLNITDIDPTYTLGDMARQRAETIARLRADGVFDMNRELDLPMILQKIAIISSATAAGYEDFCNHLLKNEYGYFFSIKLFPAIMQGDTAAESIISALEKINSHAERYEAIVIIRGGGSQTDLSCFDNYQLASNVAQFPLPVITGIGHDQDESVTDLVAHTSLKTPTAVADFILSKSVELEGYLNDLKLQFTNYVSRWISDEKSKLIVLSIKSGPRIKSVLQKKEKQLNSFFTTQQKEWQKFRGIAVSKLAFLALKSRNSTQYHLNRSDQKMKFSSERFRASLKSYLKTQNTELVNFTELNASFNPVNILKRGFSISYLNGKVLHDSGIIKEGDIMETQLEKGRIQSKITSNEISLNEKA